MSGTKLITNIIVMDNKESGAHVRLLAPSLSKADLLTDHPHAQVGDLAHAMNGATPPYPQVYSFDGTDWQFPMLPQAINDAIADAVSKTQSSEIFVDDDGQGQSWALYLQMSQTSSLPSTGTKRSLLVELLVNTNGSGNPYAPCAANAATIAAHDESNCTDGTSWITGINAEANTAEGNNVQATGLFASALKPNLGNNSGLVAVASDAAMSNIGALLFSNTTGAGSNFGVHGVVADTSIVGFWIARMGSPIPETTVAVLADAEFANAPGALALLAIGDAVFRNGTVTVPASSADTHALNAGEIKGKQEAVKFDVTTDMTRELSSNLDLTKTIIRPDNTNAVVTYTGNTWNITVPSGTLSGITVLLQELSVNVVVV